MEVDGACVGADNSSPPDDDKDDDPPLPPDEDSLTCGAGTVEVEGECVPAPSGTLLLSGFSVTQVRLKIRGRTLTGASNDPTLRVNHPVDVTVAVSYNGDPATIPLVLALGEAASGSEQGEGFCLLGGVAIAHPGQGEVISEQRIVIPKECLKDNSEDGTSADSTRRTMHPVVLVDPDERLNSGDQLPRTIVFSPSAQESAKNALSAYSEALLEGSAPKKPGASDLSLSQCRGGAGGEPGSCAVALAVEKSAGVDFELTDVKLESSVLVLNRCFSDQTALDAYAAGQGLPTTYVCNRSIVRGLDQDGKPLPEGDVRDYTYGAADLALDSTVTAFGMDHSSVTSADELLGMGESTADGFKLSVPPEDIVNNALGSTGAYSLRYFLRPASVTLQASDDSSLAAAIDRQGGFDGLVTGGKLLPIYLHAEGEQAKADGEGLGGQDQKVFEETIAIPHAPSEYSHGLYVENDCGRFNDPTNRAESYRAGAPACKPALNPRDTLLHGDYAQETDFFVVTCLTDGEDGDLPDSDDIDNNCVERPVRLARLVPREARWREQNPAAEESENPFSDDPEDPAAPGFTKDEIFGSADAAAWSMTHHWIDTFGNSSMSLEAEAYTGSTLSLADGAETSNWVGVRMSSSTFNVSQALLRIAAYGAARTKVVGTHYGYHLDFYGTRYVAEYKEIKFKNSWDWNITKEWGKATNVFASVAYIDVGLKVNGRVGFRLDLDIGAHTVGSSCNTSDCTALAAVYPDSASVGLTSVKLTPYGLVKASLNASVSVGVLRAGAAGNLDLFDLSVPIKTSISWGFAGDTNNPQAGRLKLGAWGDVGLQSTFLKGRLYLFADNQSISWCSYWGIPYPCGSGWSTFWDQTIASWGGWTYNQTLWSSPVYGAGSTFTNGGVTVNKPDPNVWYQIKPVHSGKCLDTVSQNVYQWDCHGGPEQRWRLTEVSPGVYSITNKGNSWAMDVQYASTTNRAPVFSWQWNGGNNQRVQLEQRGDAYVFKFVHSNLCADIDGISQSSGVGLMQGTCNGGNNQLFRLVP